MPSETLHFHADLYSKDAVQRAAQKYGSQAACELADSAPHIVARLEPRNPIEDSDWQTLRDEFCNEALSATVQRLRDLGDGVPQPETTRTESGAPWALLAPLSEGAKLGLGWVLESLSPVRAGAATMVLRHEQHGMCRVTVRRNGGSPMGIAHTDHLDFMLMNGGRGTAQTEGSIERVLMAVATFLRRRGNGTSHPALLATLIPHTEAQGQLARGAAASGTKRIAPVIDLEAHAVTFDFDETGIGRLALYDAVLGFADRCYVFMTRTHATRIQLHLKPRGEASAESVRALARDVTKALNQLARPAVTPPAPGIAARATGMPPLPRPRVNLDALLAELDAADPATVGLGFRAERGPGHENLRVLNIRGTGACNSECVFCIEKFNPTHRPMLKADATRDLILDSAGNFDMLFFAAGEPTIHPKLFEYVELAKSVGFTSFGMSSHFRTFSDPHFALKTLQAGFEYFDIALHAADAVSQLDVNPINDGGQSLFEALKGLAVLLRLAEALALRISITQKIVISRLNVMQLEPIFRSTYDRGVRHFIFQPVRTLGLAPELQAKLAITEDEMIPYLNDLLRKTEGLDAVIKPYGFSRQGLFSGGHVEHEQNRVKNIYGKSRAQPEPRWLPMTREDRPTDGRHWVEVRTLPDNQFAFATDGRAPVLDDGLREGLDLPFGCRMGSCGMCCAVLLEGRVDQSSQIFLTEEQMQQGFVLMCQARPLSDVVLRVCTDDEIDQL